MARCGERRTNKERRCPAPTQCSLASPESLLASLFSLRVESARICNEMQHLPTSDDSDDSEPGVDVPDRSLRSKRSTDDSFCVLLGKAPPATARIAARPKWLPPGRVINPTPGNPVYGFRMQLYCRTGFHLAIFPDGSVRGLDIDQHANAIVEFSSVSIGEVQIKSIANNLYLAMNSEGHLYGEADGNSSQTVFVEYMFGQYNCYLSRHWAHLGWYAAIKKSGKIKPGRQTRWGQKAVQFLPRRINA